MIVAGVDIGSLTGKALILNDGKIRSWSIILTGPDSAETSKQVINQTLEKSNLSLKDIDYAVSTGYGRIMVPFADKNLTEISCHAKGAIDRQGNGPMTNGNQCRKSCRGNRMDLANLPNECHER